MRRFLDWYDPGQRGKRFSLQLFHVELHLAGLEFSMIERPICTNPFLTHLRRSAILMNLLSCIQERRCSTGPAMLVIFRRTHAYQMARYRRKVLS